MKDKNLETETLKREILNYCRSLVLDEESKAVASEKSKALDILAKFVGIKEGEGVAPLTISYQEYKKRATYSLFLQQRKFVFSQSRYRVAVCSRRAGKTFASAMALLLRAIESEEPITTAYIGITGKAANLVLLPTIEKVAKTLDIVLKVDRQTLRVFLPNGSQIVLAGNEEKGDCEKLRGMALGMVIIDEAQSHKNNLLKDLIDDILEPGLVDHQGDLILIGTPPFKKIGYFVESIHNPNWDYHY